MTVLVDHEINERLDATPPLATGIIRGDITSATAPVQAASLDLTIGEIFKPITGQVDDGKLKSSKELILATGQTAVLRTREKLELGDDLIGICFPPASLSAKGLLVTNPGQIDPGFIGPLHFTVINMGNQPLILREKDRIIRVIFMKLSATPVADYSKRRSGAAAPFITPELLQRLSVDFLNVNKRAQKIADKSVKKARISSAFIAVTITLITAVLPVYLLNRPSDIIMGKIEATNSSISNLSARITVLEGLSGEATINDRLNKLESEVSILSKQH